MQQKKAIWLLEELDTANCVGLIERVQQGQGKPAKIYVKKFSTVENSEDLQKSELLTSQNEPFSGLICGNQEVEKRNANYTDKNYTEKVNQSINRQNRSFEPPGTGLMDGLIIPCADSKLPVNGRASTSFVRGRQERQPPNTPCRKFVSPKVRLLTRKTHL